MTTIFYHSEQVLRERIIPFMVGIFPTTGITLQFGRG